MGLKIWQRSDEKIWGGSATLKEAFQILTTTLLSLLLPLSFLLLARLITAQYLLDTYFNFTSKPFSLLFSIFLYTNPTLLHGLVSIVSVSTFVHGLSNGRVVIPSVEPPERDERWRIYIAWSFLCTLQVFVGLGIEGSIGSGVDETNFGYERSLLSQMLFFLGLHETMLHWSRMVVKPVVHDTVFGYRREERWVERVVMAGGFSLLWWWRLKDEVESLVVVAEIKRELLRGGCVAYFVGWWLYYLTVIIGIVRVVRGVVSVAWFGMILLSKKVENKVCDSSKNDEKV